MEKMNFYTQNGWCGSNYDNKLTTKDIAKKVREFAKKNFPNFVFSVTSRWSMYTDSMYIVLKAGTVAPFVEGSRSAQRGYMRTMSDVTAYKDELHPDVFAALDAVCSYAASFRYNDSDGMIDYFDTNFFLKIEVSDEYQIKEAKEKKVRTKESKNETKKNTTPAEPVKMEGVEVVEYSEKVIAVFGETKQYKEQLKQLGGKFNPALKHNGEKRAGWIFSKKSEKQVRALLAPASEKAEETRVYHKKADGMEVTAYLVPNPDFIEKGEYKPTELDNKKAAVDILITSIDGSYYTLHLQKPVNLPEKGVKRYGNGDIAVTRRVLDKLEKQYNVLPDF